MSVLLKIQPHHMTQALLEMEVEGMVFRAEHPREEVWGITFFPLLKKKKRSFFQNKLSRGKKGMLSKFPVFSQNRTVGLARTTVQQAHYPLSQRGQQQMLQMKGQELRYQ